jgi:hypothetical protein
MGHRARNALLKQAILSPGTIISSEVYDGIDFALVNVYNCLIRTYTHSEILQMTPLWIGDREHNVWRLVLGPGSVEILPDRMEIDYYGDYFDTWFQLEEQVGGITIADYTRESNAVEDGEWEEVESEGQSDSMDECDSGIFDMEFCLHDGDYKVIEMPK